ncbi:uncharacterized protein [Littorina saxatilis]|uniref:uncharacterized protein isoform X2 n=1 Tax=Littorina saxatilis TaxID=31220 RepID=UPI0038B4B65C
MSKASKVVRTEGEGVSETAACFMEFVLHQGQIKVLNSGEHLVYLTGPPGTGKTVMLILQGEQWLKDGHDVHVVSMYDESLAASLFMIHSLRAKCQTKGHKVHLHEHQLGTEDIDEAVDKLAACAQDGHLYVIVDEVDGSEFKLFCEKLVSRVRSLHLWAAHIYHRFTPQHFTEFALAVPLRTPGAITREIQRSDFVGKFGQVRDYEQNVYPHTDGPLIRDIRHQGPDHPDNVMPRDCEACGTQLASVLVELHVGGTAGTIKQTPVPGNPEPLQYRDVFLLCLTGFKDCGSDGTEQNTCGIIKGLRQCAIPVIVLSDDDTTSRSNLMTDVVTMQGPDSVIATSAQCVFGLERKIVAWVQPASSDSMSEQFDILLACSRTSGQLITITTSRDSEQVESSGSKPKGCMKMESRNEIPTSDSDIEDMFIELGQACITEDIVRDVDAVLQLYIIHGNGEEHPVFLNLKKDGGSVGRGEWDQSRIAGIFRVLAQDVPIFFRGDRAELFQAFSDGRIKVQVNNSTPLLRIEQYWKKISALYEERFGGNTHD